MVNNEKLKGVPVVLLLNKADLLRTELERHKFSNNFPDFTGSNSYAEVVVFLKDLYMRQYTGSEQAKIFPIVMNSMDLKMVVSATHTIADIARKGYIIGQNFKLYDPDEPIVLFKAIPNCYRDVIFTSEYQKNFRFIL
jgi:hypothetical protein